jgi:hypothetical protein
MKKILIPLLFSACPTFNARQETTIFQTQVKVNARVA